MGNRAGRNAEVSKIKVDYDQEAIEGGGGRSVISQPLDEYIDFESLWSGMVKLLKDPPRAGLLKATECEETSETEFTTKHFFSVGRIGALLGFKDFETTEHCLIDLTNTSVVSERYDGDHAHIQTTYTKIHTDPLRVECWLELPAGRSASRMVALMLQGILTKAREYVNPCAEGDMPVAHEVDSLTGSGLKSAVTEPLDEHFTDLDMLWDGYIQVLKTSPKDGEGGNAGLAGAMGGKDSVVPKIASFEVKEISPTEFNVITVIDGESLDRGFNWFQRVATPVDTLLALRSAGDKTTISVYILDRAKAQITNQVFNDQGLLVCEVFTRFYENPLRAEVWVTSAKSRKAGRFLCVVVWTFLSEIIKDFKKTSADVSGEVADTLDADLDS